MDMIRGENERGKCDLWRLEKEFRTEAGDGRLKTDRPIPKIGRCIGLSGDN